MATIHKKVWPEYFEKILSNEEYTGRKMEVVATYIIKTKNQTFWSPEEVEKYGFQVIQFKPK